MDLRKVLRIARWEVTKNAGGVDRRTVFIAVVAIILVAAAGPAIAGNTVSLDAGIYRVGIGDDGPYARVAASDDTFAIKPNASQAALDEGRIDLAIRNDRVVARRDAKGLAALSEFRSAVERYNRNRLTEAENLSAAFPVRVSLEYRTQSSGTPLPDTPGDTTDTNRNSTGGAGGGGTGGDGSVAGGGTTGDSGVSGDLGGLTGGLTSRDTVVNSPAAISPPFPFESLVLAFVFIIPLNFLIQAYGSTFLAERLNRRGELMLVSPVTRVDIVAGKTMPYFLGAIAVEAVIAVGLSMLVTGTPGGVVSLLAVAPLVLLFLSATFLGAMFARSFKELTFVTVTITVTLTSYAFVPAIFTDIGAVALISPLTIVVRDLQQETIGLAEFAFSVTPPTLTALTLFGLGTGLYREEDMFTQRAIPHKVLDALAVPVRRSWHVGVVTAILVPFVFLAELLAIALLFALGELSVPLILGFVAIIEEVGKSLHIYASHAHRRFDARLRTALLLGGCSGVGFFLAEKLAVLAQVIGLPELAVGRAALQTGIASGPLLIGFLLAPLALHVVTASISATGAGRGRRAYGLSLVLAVIIHLAYNLAVLEAIGGV